jgi:membrane-bound serine protease (ClpP class)
MSIPRFLRRTALPPVGFLLAVFLILVFLPLAAPARAEVLKIVINDTIHPMTLEYVERALAQAQQENAKAVLIEIDTPGGLLDSTHEIVEKVLASPVPVIIYVTPSGSRAASAGFFILQAADIAAMAPGTNTGAAHPVGLGGAKLDDVMEKKIENDAAALMRSVASKRGRNVDGAESTVRESKSFTEQEALAKNLIDYVASSEQDLFQQMRGKPIKRFDGKTLVLDLTGEPIRPFERTLKQKIFGILMNPNIAVGLLALGMFCIYVELNNPGYVLPGTVGVIAIVLAGFALNMLPVRFAALALIVTAFVLFALEAKLASHGVLGIGGVVALTLGSLFLVDGPIQEMRVYLSTALAISLPLGVITVFLMTIALKARAGKRVSGMEGMVGEIGTARTALTPSGKVFVHGEIWDAVASSPVAEGAEVTVTRVNGLRVDVDPVGSKSSGV